ncbi:PREDICTED: FMRFamide receptor-like [Dinoponera quadriceps]|uniref:FMRFamide receptor-like n=1 Tax=Dinoponera quadriceps TaxID=609295 RepID=A0A6P3XNX2_DINQU|nr:PREDICTED: FMRFamide receptor-like [Dinoponera quadriceps]XP_014479694.1 PREDICTED: FMRFamide receptor-like [Dinoponera quadriceps]XP_014479695.1 PREDICTED: FMRFamide receptor-like [Dinoponera quadriceps]
MAMNLTTTTTVPGYYNISNITEECGQKFPTCDLTRFIIYGVLTNLIGVFGILGNTVSMIVLSRPQMKSSINFLLIGLASSDNMLIITAILIFGLTGIDTCGITLFYNYSTFVLPKIFKLVFLLICTARIATVYLTLAVTVERYIAVCHPLKARSFCTYGRARMAVLVITVFSFLYNLPKFWEVELHEQIHWKYNITVYCMSVSELRKNAYYVHLYINWLYLIVYSLFPFVSLVIFNTAIYRRVKQANKDLKKLSHQQRSEIRLATMLLCVVIVFLICNILPLISNIFETFVEGGPPSLMVRFGHFLVFVNSSINFIIYIILGETFKKTFLKIFLSCWRQKQKFRQDSIESQTTNVSIVSSTSNIELDSVNHLNHSNTINSNNIVHSNVDMSNGGTSESVKLSRLVNSESCLYYAVKSPSQMSRTLNGYNAWGSRKRNHRSTL